MVGARRGGTWRVTAPRLHDDTARTAARLLRVAGTLLAVSYVGFLVFALAAGGVSDLEEEYDKNVIGLFRAQAARHHDTLDGK